MNDKHTITLVDAVSLEPITGLTADKLRFFTVSGTVRIFFTNFAENGGGSYSFDTFTTLDGGSYVPLTELKQCFLYKYNEGTGAYDPVYRLGVQTLGDLELLTDSCLKSSGDQTFPDIMTFSKAPKSSANAVASDELVRYAQLTSLSNSITSALAAYLKKSGSSSVQEILNDFTVGNDDTPTSLKYYGPVTADKHVTTKEYVSAAIQNYVTGNWTAFQESPNILRVIYSGTAEAGRVFRTISAAITYAKTYSGSGNEYHIMIHGKGVTGSLLTNYNLYSASGFDVYPYCHLEGANSNIPIVVEETDYIQGTGSSDLGKLVLKNLTIVGANDGHETNFKWFVFENCRFEFLTAGILSLEQCELRGVNTFLIGSGGSLTITNVKGSIYHTNIVPTESGTNPDYIYSSNL